jgi:hypothetical protein
MHWIKFFEYELSKRKTTKWVWMTALFYCLWFGLLMYFSHMWELRTERLLQQSYFKQYYIEQSGYLAYVLIGCHIIVQSVEWMTEKHAYFEVMFKESYIAFKMVQFWFFTLGLVWIHGTSIQLIYGLAFNEIIILKSLWIQLFINTCIFSGIMVLWIRAKSTYVLLSGILLLMLHPNLTTFFPDARVLHWLIPFNRGRFETYPIWLFMGYYWLSYQLQQIKPK